MFNKNRGVSIKIKGDNTKVKLSITENSFDLEFIMSAIVKSLVKLTNKERVIKAFEVAIEDEN